MNLQSFSEFQKKNSLLSKSLCLAKWQQTSLLIPVAATHSCHHPVPHSLDCEKITSNPQMLFHTLENVRDRQQMLAGKRPQGCSYCWNIEDSGGISDRISKSSEAWAEPHLANILQKSPEESVLPTYLEVAFSNRCNFACVYCSPQSSSRWQNEVKRFGGFPTSQPFNTPDGLRSSGFWPITGMAQIDLQKAFWANWPLLRERLKVLRITGGEPLLSQDLWKLLAKLSAEPIHNLQLAVNSNLGVHERRILKLAHTLPTLQTQISRFTLFASLDGIHSAVEYTRYGLSIARFKKNAELLLQKVALPMRFTLMATLNIVSLEGLLPLLGWIKELREKYPQHSIGIDTPYLRYPNFLALTLADPERLRHLHRAVEYMQAHDFPEREVERLRRVLEWAIRGTHFALGQFTERELALRDLQVYLHELDRRRDLDWRSACPEFAQWLDQQGRAGA